MSSGQGTSDRIPLTFTRLEDRVPRPLRLMTWNVRSLRDDRAAVIRVIRACAPDVLFVQEAPRFLRAQSKLAALARESGLVVAAGGRPAAGVALLTTLRVDVDAPASHLLSKAPRLHQRGLAVGPADARRPLVRGRARST